MGLAAFRARLSPLLTLVLLASACAPATSAGLGAPPPAPKGDTGPARAAVQQLTWADSALSATLDPQTILGRGPRRYDIFEPLIGQEAGGDPTMKMLAESWKSLDSTTWQFSLYKDSLFHDGSKVTSADVVFSFERVMNPDLKIAALTRIPTVASVKAVDDYTVNITTKAPDPLILRRLAAIAILPKAAFEKLGAQKFGLAPIGSGPFKVKEFVPSDHVVLAPFTEHPRRKAILQQVTVKNVPEPSARVAGLRTGDLDFSMALPWDSIDTLKSANLETFSVDFGQSGGFKLDTLSDTPLKDKRVRQALNYAVNKDLIVSQIYRGFTKPEQGQILQPEVFGFNPNLKPYPYDPKKAKDLLAQAGYPNGFKSTMEAYSGSRPEMRDIGILIQSEFKDIGVDVEYTPYNDFAVWADKFYGRTDRAPILGTGLNLVPAMDPDFGLVWFASTQPEGLRYYNNPAFDAAYQASTQEMDATKRRDLIWKMLDIMYEDPPYLFVTQVSILFAHSKKVQGIEKRFDQDPLLEKVWISA